VNSVIATDSDQCPRAYLYQLLGEPFRFPDEQRVQHFLTGHWQQQLAGCLDRLALVVPGIDSLQLDASAKEYEVEFIALYEVGMGGAPCPLHSGHYARDRMKIMEEVLRFYKFFAYQPDRSADRFPDHINFELEFMGHMAQLYDHALVSGGDVESPLLAQRDFINRNLSSWMPELNQRIKQRSRISFFKNVAHCVSLVIQQENEMLEQLVIQSESVRDGEHPNE
jgi:DMSO reductase family type II enzyme chaperone